MEKCGAIVKFFHQTIKASSKLKEIQCLLHLPENRLIKAVETSIVELSPLNLGALNSSSTDAFTKTKTNQTKKLLIRMG